MEHAAIALAVLGIATTASVFFVARTIPICQRLGLIDPPSPRKVHLTPLPRGAGVAMLLAFVLGVAMSYCFNVERFASETERIVLLLAGSIIIVAIMLVDDAMGIAPLPKLGWQIGAAMLVVLPRFRGEHHGIVIERFNTPIFGTISLPLVLAVLLTIFWIVGMMNTINWVDGLDGLAGSVTLVSCVILFLHTYFWPRDNPQFTISLLPIALGSAVIGFLPFNWHPAKIIMGDSGANFIGYALAICAIIGGAKIATALLALGLPILDVAWVILYRIAHGRSPLVADRGHLHHRLLDSGWSQARIVLFVSGVSLIAGIASLLLPTRGAKLGAIVVLGLVLLGLLARLASRPPRAGATNAETTTESPMAL